jgi:tetratricopeptide (TPR) repeat protein
MQFNLSFEFVLLSCSLSWAGSDSAALTHIQAARGLLARNEFDKAINELLPVVRSAKQLGIADQTVGVALNDLGYSYRMVGRCRDAIGVLTEAKRILDKTAAQPALIQTNGINLLASYLECGDSSRAAKYWARSLAPLAARPGLDRAPLWAAGGTALTTRKRYAESDALYTQAITIWEREPGKNLERLVVARSNRGVDRAHLGRMEEAITDAARSEESLLSLTRLPPSIRAIVFNNMGLIYLMSGQFDKAGKDLESALASLEHSPGCQCGPMILANYALLLRDTGRAQAAKETQRQARELARRLGSESAGATVDISAFGAFGPK